MKRNHLSILVALLALTITGCTSRPRGRTVTSSSSESLTSAPTSESPTSEAGTSESQTSNPTSQFVTSDNPTSVSPTSQQTSVNPTSIGTSEHATSEVSSTSIISSSAGTSEIPSTSVGTSELPSTSAGTSELPSTSAGTSELPPTSQGTSLTPVTSAGTSLTPVTSAGTSAVPTTSEGTSTFTSATAPITSATSELSTSGTSSLIPTGYYSQCEGLSGSALQNKLYSINQPKNPSYDWSRYEDADEAEDDPTCILSLYTRHNIKKNSHCGSYSWTTWNREHIWTQTKYPASKTDNHNIFACEGQINGYRSDKPFAEGGEIVVVHGHTTECRQTDSTFEPCDDAKGEVARSVMYGTVMYRYDMTLEIDSIALALKWHFEHPVTSREIKRNEVVYKNQGNRNPFIDHPEYATLIWGSL